MIRIGRNCDEFVGCHIPQLIASHTAFAAKAGLMRHTIGQAEQQAMSAQAFHQGESAAAFQGAHAWFVAAAAKVNTCWISRKPLG